MRTPRIFVDVPLHPEGALRLPEEPAHYVARVLRLGVGSRLVLFNGDGCDYAAEVVTASRSTLDVRVDARLPAIAPSPLSITLVQAISRGERMDYTLQKATELGVAALQPVSTARCEVRLAGDRLARRMAHWHSVVVSACEQCGRADLPTLHSPVALDGWLDQAPRGDRLLLDPAADRPLARWAGTRAVELLVGPEGGLEEAERERFRRNGGQPVRLGPRVLRTETAGPAAIAVLQALAGDFG